MSYQFKPKPFKPLTEAQVHEETIKCLHCARAPCCTSCPARCNPAAFMWAIRTGEPCDIQRAAAMILRMNPMGATCGTVCPDTFCQSKCARDKLDDSIAIPCMQTHIIETARSLGLMPKVEISEKKKAKIAIVGAGPAGISAAAYLGASGYTVDVYEQNAQPGGDVLLIPPHRLSRNVIANDFEYWSSLETVNLHLNSKVDYRERATKYDAVGVACGAGGCRKMGIPGEDLAIDFRSLLSDPEKFRGKLGSKCVVLGGGAVSVDCAVTARMMGCEEVILMYRRGASEMPITTKERQWLAEASVDIVNRTVPIELLKNEFGEFAGLKTHRVEMPHKSTGKTNAVPVKGSEAVWSDVSSVILAVGQMNLETAKSDLSNVFWGGDAAHGASTIVQAVAGGKNMAKRIECFVEKLPAPTPLKLLKNEWIHHSDVKVPGLERMPVDLTTDFYGMTLPDPFLIACSTMTDGYTSFKKTLHAGWCGGFIRAFVGISVDKLKQVCGDIVKLRAEFPDRMIGAGTVGPISGDDESDKKQWQRVTTVLEEAGAQCIEYWYSMPDSAGVFSCAAYNTIAQSPEMCSKMTKWILETGDPKVPKQFKISGSVTSVRPIINAIREVASQFPHALVGVNVANLIPFAQFKEQHLNAKMKASSVGFTGVGALPLSFHSLVDAGGAAGLELHAAGGIRDHKAAAYFLALGAKHVSLFSSPRKETLSSINDLREGLSYYLQQLGMSSIKDVIGILQPNPVRNFEELTPIKLVSTWSGKLCTGCCNCFRCPYDAIHSKGWSITTDPEKCVGCSLCVMNCPGKALTMRPRTEEETKAHFKGVHMHQPHLEELKKIQIKPEDMVEK